MPGALSLNPGAELEQSITKGCRLGLTTVKEENIVIACSSGMTQGAEEAGRSETVFKGSHI